MIYILVLRGRAFLVSTKNSRFPGMRRVIVSYSRPIPFPEAAILLVSDGDRDLWPGPTPEVRDSQTSRHSAHVQSQVWQIWLVLVSIYCVYIVIQNRNVVGPGQGSRYFQRMTKGTPGDEVDSRRNRFFRLDLERAQSDGKSENQTDWTFSEVAILVADQKKRRIWRREREI